MRTAASFDMTILNDRSHAAGVKAEAVRTGRARDDMKIARLPEPRPLDRYLRELRAARQVEIVLELQEASRLIREGARDRR
jgi:hypothetical protein